MVRDVTTCDNCGRPIERGKSHRLSLSPVPKVRTAGRKSSWDLCPLCAARLKMQMGRREYEGESTMGDCDV